MSIEKITNEEIAENSVESLNMRPTSAGLTRETPLTAQEMRKAFDKLPKLIADKVNELIDALEAIGDDSILNQIMVEEGVTLAQWISGINQSIGETDISDVGATLTAAIKALHDRIGTGDFPEGMFGPEDVANVINAIRKIDEIARTSQDSAYQSAQNAAGSATSAAGSASAAENAKNAAVAAKNEAASSAESAGWNASSAASSKTAAETAQGKAEDAQEAAEEAKTDAETAAESAESAAATAVAAHNVAADAHADIRALAEGRSRGKVYDTYNELMTALEAYATKAATQAELELGDAIYIRAASVPDAWISGFLDVKVTPTPVANPFSDPDTESVNVGYVIITRFDADKVDMADYYQKTEADALLGAKANSADVETALAGKADKSSTYTKNETDNLLSAKADNADVVKHTAQSLTETQKAQARRNVNAAATDGEYEGMTVGNAEQLVATVGVTDKVPYLFRTAGGSADIGNRLNDKLVGGTIVWNQLYKTDDIDRTVTSHGVTFIDNRNGSYTISGTCTESFFVDGLGKSLFTTNHVYVILGSPDFKITAIGSSGTVKKMIGSGELTWYFDAVEGKNYNETVYLQSHDLTAMFGSTIADYVYSLEQATAGAGVAWFKKLFPKPYYVYNAGELMSVCTNEHITRGFNVWDEEWEVGSIDTIGQKDDYTTNTIRSKNYIPVFGGASYYFKCQRTLTLCWYDEDKKFIGVNYPNDSNGRLLTSPSDARFIKFSPYQYGTTYNHDICINLSWSGYRNGEYEPYVEHRYPLSPVELRGIPKLDASNNLYFDGDTYEKDGKVTRRYGIVDLGTLNWTYIDSYTNPVFAVKFTDAKGNDTGKARMLCDLYESHYGDYTRMPDMKIQIRTSGTYNVFITNTNYTSAAAFKSAMSGVYLVYELATPTTETANPFHDPQIVDDFGTEEYVDALATAETAPRDVAIPVGHETFYQANLRDKLQHLPVMPREPGDYIVRYDGVNCTFVSPPLTHETWTFTLEDDTTVAKEVVIWTSQE